MPVNHESAFSGHLGVKKTEVRILQNFFWDDYIRMSSEFAVSATYAREPSRGIV